MSSLSGGGDPAAVARLDDSRPAARRGEGLTAQSDAPTDSFGAIDQLHGAEVQVTPARVLLQEVTGVPCECRVEPGSATLAGVPDRELDPDPALVRALLRQAPRALRDLGDPHLVAYGWDNAIFRIGATHAVRLPVRDLAAPLVAKEARWADTLTAPLAGSGVRAPVPVFVGEPAHGYPWRWTIVPWLDGDLLDDLPVDRRGRVADDLATALAAIHRAAPREAPRNPYRGCPLADRADAVAGRRGVVEAQLGAATAAVYGAWEAGLDAPAWQGPQLWLHGDLHPRNLLHAGGRLVGLLDLGDLGAGDPACDLGIAWLAFDATARARFRARLTRHDEATWVRARAWAASIVTAVAADPGSRVPFARVVAHAAAQLAPGSG